MEFFARFWDQTRAHLRGLTGSQRLAIGLSAVIIVISLVWLLRWANERALEPLPLASMNEQQRGEVIRTLDRLGYEHRVEEEAILVRPSQKRLILARLMEEESVAGAVSIDFAQLLENDSPWMSESDKQWRRTAALAGELSKTISNMEGIARAHVFIDNSTRRGFGGRSVPASATVSVWARAGPELSKKRVHMLASLVSGAVAGMDIANVRVIDARGGRSFTASDPEEAIAGDLLEMQRSQEGYFENKVRERLSYIPGVLVSVFAELESNLTHTQKTTLDKPVVSKSMSESMTDQRGPTSAEPGTRPNVGARVAATAMQETSQTERTEEEFLGERGRETVSSQNTRGAVRKLTASIGVPRSWLVRTFQEINGADKQPDEAALQQLEAKEFPKIVEAVSRTINTEDAGMVAVSSFPDVEWSEPGPRGEAAQAGATMAGFVSENGLQLGLVGLAGMSLLMMWLMVRKASRERRRPGSLAAEFEEPSEMLTVGLEGRAGFPEALLGHELDEESLRRKQVSEQVTQLVDNDPKMAAALVKSWIEQEAS